MPHRIGLRRVRRVVQTAAQQTSRHLERARALSRRERARVLRREGVQFACGQHIGALRDRGLRELVHGGGFRVREGGLQFHDLGSSDSVSGI